MPGYGRGGKPTSGFPPRPQPLEIAKGATPTFPPLRRLLCLFKTKSKTPKPKKGDPGKLATQPPSSGSFLDEKMLVRNSPCRGQVKSSALSQVESSS